MAKPGQFHAKCNYKILLACLLLVNQPLTPLPFERLLIQSILVFYFEPTCHFGMSIFMVAACHSIENL